MHDPKLLTFISFIFLIFFKATVTYQSKVMSLARVKLRFCHVSTHNFLNFVNVYFFFNLKKKIYRMSI